MNHKQLNKWKIKKQFLAISMRSEVEEHCDFKRWSNERHEVFGMILDNVKQLQRQESPN